MDLITQHTENTSRVMYFENTGNQLVSGIQINQLDGTPVTSDPFMTPTFADIDNDGDAVFFYRELCGHRYFL